MTVAGQPTINYTYDNANRLTQITQGTSIVTLAYDDAGRRTTLALPNGVITEYAYDAASQLTGLTYKKGTAVLGNLTYEYDAGGRRTRVGGSLARTGLPQIVSATSYDAANRQTAFGSQSLTYDVDGNLTSDGINSYGWNARNQLVSITGPGLDATFQYDGFGKRISKTIHGTTTSYLYDRGDVVQVQVGGSVSANMLLGLGVDEVLTRSDSSGTWALLTDALGSTVALTDSSGSIQTQHTYEPFGRTTTNGTLSDNPSQYTGRDNDGTGMYYYRARYYSPTLQRFISEDPIRFGGGVNFYSYVENDPINAIDPSGLTPYVCCRPLLGKRGKLTLGIPKHCYILVVTQGDGSPDPHGTSNLDGTRKTYGLHDPEGCQRPVPNDPSDRVKDSSKECVRIPKWSMASEEYIAPCSNQPSSCRGCDDKYRKLGPNSNTFVSDVLKCAGIRPPNLDVIAPGYNRGGYRP